MDYLLSEEQKMIKAMIDEFAGEKIKPLARHSDQNREYPAKLIQEMAGLGIMGIPYPEEYGGVGGDNIAYMLAVEAISRYCAATGVIVSAHTSLAVEPIWLFGSEEQKKKFMPPLCSGAKLGCFALTEPQAGSDAANLRLSAKPIGDRWVLNGTKQFVTNSVQADLAIVFAATEPQKKSHGITAFIVEKGTQGFSIGKQEEKLGIKASSTAELVFEECAIPMENRLGELNGGFKVAMVTLDGGRIGIAAQALGIARGSIEDSLVYAKERQQFGQPIIQFQGLKWYLAEMAMEYEAAWLLTYRAALMKDRGMRHTKEAAMAKLKASEVAEFCASRAVQIHGGYGYTREYDPERYFRDSKITQIYEGTSEIMREVIAGSLLR
jgi:butyryl-CoA dehydrogenase